MENGEPSAGPNDAAESDTIDTEGNIEMVHILPGQSSEPHSTISMRLTGIIPERLTTVPDITQPYVQVDASTAAPAAQPNRQPRPPTNNVVVMMERLDPNTTNFVEVFVVPDDDDPASAGNSAALSEVAENSTQTSPSISSTKKRKRSAGTPKKIQVDDDADGSTCPICLEQWEMSGTHRLTSLKCGHLFGHSCIKRWLQECSSGTRFCPSCKTKAAMRDLRFLYAKKVCAVDHTEEYRLKDLLEEEKKKNAQLQSEKGMIEVELSLVKNIVTRLEGDIERLKRIGDCGSPVESFPKINYKLFMERNIEISKNPGCRVLVYGQTVGKLLVSNKSSQGLFPGYGVRFLDIKTYKPTDFILMSSGRSIRDLSLNATEDYLASTTMERSSKIFSVQNKETISVITPSDKPLWACAFDKTLTNFMYLGSQHGSTYIYDIRHVSSMVDEFSNDGDYSPVINICSVLPSDDFPLGGFVVCKLQSIWFYEYAGSPRFVVSTRLTVEGPFISICLNTSSNTLLISTRPSSKYAQSRYIVADIVKVNDSVGLNTRITFYGSKVAPIMSRSTQIPVKNNTLIAAYQQDVKMLSVWGVQESRRIQTLPVTDVIYDTCPIIDGDNTYLAAVTECKSRIYKVIAEY